jgi:hypothetical protein
MTAAELRQSFGDAPDRPFLNYEAFDKEAITRDLEKDGFSIVRGLIPQALIPPVRAFWLEKFKEKPEGRVTWAPYIGQANHVGFSKDAFQYLYRACDFLWNEPFHLETREISVRLHALRNLVIGRDPAYGMRFTDGRYGVFMTTSYYPAGEGFMEAHNDGVTEETTLIHCLVPFTFRGTDYADGGITIIDRAGVFHDLEKELRPGDAVFYDGALKHGVRLIKALPGKDLGRLQIIPIPTYFADIARNPRALDAIPSAAFFGAKLAVLKNQLRIKLGMQPGLR